MFGSEDGAEESEKRAEMFEVLAHQTRIKILKALEGQPMSFAELKRNLGIESSGNLQHHLGKLHDLIRQGDDGKYTLNDDAKEALRLLDTMEEAPRAIPTAQESAFVSGPLRVKSSERGFLLIGIALAAIVLLLGVYLYVSVPVMYTDLARVTPPRSVDAPLGGGKDVRIIDGKPAGSLAWDAISPSIVYVNEEFPIRAVCVLTPPWWSFKRLEIKIYEEFTFSSKLIYEQVIWQDISPENTTTYDRTLNFTLQEPGTIRVDFVLDDKISGYSKSTQVMEPPSPTPLDFLSPEVKDYFVYLGVIAAVMILVVTIYRSGIFRGSELQSPPTI